jgi:hypothetical protein
MRTLAARRWGRRLSGLLSSLLFLATVIGAAWLLTSTGHRALPSGSSTSTPRVDLTPAERRSAADFPSFRGALPVLATDAPYAGARAPSLTASTLAHELALLKAAGFTTISANQAVRFGRGRLSTTKPLLLCIDGSVDSALRIVDPILARLGMRALLLLKPSYLRRNGRSLRMSDLAMLAHSSRWQIGLLVRPDADPRQIERWLRKLTVQNVDAGAALAFATEPSAKQLESISALRGRFLLVLADTSQPRFANAGDRKTALPRLSLPGDAGELLPLLARLIPRSVDDPAPLDRATAWQAEGRSQPPVHGILRLAPPPHTWQAVLYDPAATATWRDYCVDVTVSGLSSAASGTLLLRATGSQRLALSLSSVSLTATGLDDDRSSLLGRTPLAARSTHRVVACVKARRLTVRVDGRLLLRADTPAEMKSGGLGLGAWRESSHAAALRFGDLSVEPS